MPRLLDREQVADALGVSVKSVDKLAHTCELRKVKVGARAVFHAADVLAYIERCSR